MELEATAAPQLEQADKYYISDNTTEIDICNYMTYKHIVC
jgi:hypothetical protein